MSTDARPIALWVIPVADLGGVARHVLDVFNVGMKDYRLVLFCPEGLLAERVRAMGGAVIAADFGPDFGYVKSLRSLDATIRALKPAIVHSHLAYADFIAAAVVMRYPRVSLVSTEHGIAGDDEIYHSNTVKAGVRATLHHARLRRNDALIAVSESTKNEMRKKWKVSNDIHVIPNGVDRVDFEPLVRTESLRVLSLSRLAPEKRIDQLILAFKQLHDERPDATLTIAGTGPEKDNLQRLVDREGLASFVEFPGFVDADMAMKEHEVLVQLSSWENCSYTLLDAVNNGLGVVATPVGGNPEILDKKFLAGADDPQRISDLISGQAIHLEKRPRLALSWPSKASMTAKIEEVYSVVL
ncbi:hypothetical protein GCM10009861_17150 [Neomicrococcus aestuarii]|nr:glycosyltransferase family 4 protein [Neomicrococcus aestuarii]